MNKYLIDLLSEVNTVIIPGFGALTVVNRTNKDFMFMPYLKYDDGLLADFIAKREDWPIGEAKDLISKYVNDILITLNKGGKYDFPEIGSFKKVEDDITFENWKEQTFIQSKAVETPLQESETMDEIVDAIAEKDTVIEEQETLTEFNRGSITAGMVVMEETSSIEEPKIEETKEEIPLELEIEAVIEEPTTFADSATPKEENQKIASEDEQWEDDLDVPPIGYKPEQPKKPILEKAVPDKKPNRTPVILWAIIGLIFIGGLTTAGFYWEDVKRVFGNLGQPEYIADVEEEEIEEIEIPEDIQEDEEQEEFEDVQEETETTIEAEEPTVTPKQEISQPAVISNGSIDKNLPFQVIAGSFSEEQNAHKLIAKLKANGYDAAIFGVINNMHMVSIASFSTEQEYQSKKAQLQSAGPHWLFKRK